MRVYWVRIEEPRPTCRVYGTIVRGNGMEVDKQQFDAMLGKLLKAAPLPKAEIAPKRASPRPAPKRSAKKQPRP